MSLATFRFRVTGRVQGVGYRYFALGRRRPWASPASPATCPTAASRWWRKGPPRRVQAFEERLREGPAFARVEVVDRSAARPRGRPGISHPVIGEKEGYDDDIERAAGGHPRRARLPQAGHRVQGHHHAAQGPEGLPATADLLADLVRGAPGRARCWPSRAGASSSGGLRGGSPGPRVRARAQAREAARRTRRATYELEYGIGQRRDPRGRLSPGSGCWSWTT